MDNDIEIIFLDMDGVLCNYEKKFEELSGLSHPDYEKKHGKQSAWDLINSQGSKFWASLEPMPDMKTLKRYVFDNFLKIGILSSTGKSKSKTNYAEEGKMRWLNNHGFLSMILSEDIHLVESAQLKKDFALPKRILVDDYAKNIQGWNNNKGIGILHTSAANSIKQLSRYV